MKFKLLLVEDDCEDQNTFKDSLEVFASESDLEWEIVISANLVEALETLDNSFDGAVVDLKLGNDDGKGNEFVEQISTSNLRIPVSIFTGQPGHVVDDSPYIAIYVKGENGVDEILRDFVDIHRSGMTKVMGGRGQIEVLLNRVYKESIVHQRAAWIKYGKANSEESEKALLRHTLNHLMHMVDLDQGSFFPEEFYIHPVMRPDVKTGCIVEHNTTKQRYVVMNPSCDLAVRDVGAGFKADHILLAKIENANQIYDRLTTKKKRKTTKTKHTENLRKNNAGYCFHALPPATDFDEGFLNFEATQSIESANFREEFGDLVGQISPTFLKDIIARFSSYIGRQGQPEIHYSF